MSLSRAVAHMEGTPDDRHLAQKHSTTYSIRKQKTVDAAELQFELERIHSACPTRSGAVLSYRIRVVGQDFDAEDDGSHYPDAETAARAAVKAAIALAADEVNGGKSGTALEARLEDGADVIARYIVALSVESVERS